MKKIFFSIIFILFHYALYSDSISVNIYNRTNNSPAGTGISFGIISNNSSIIAEQYIKLNFSVSNSSDYAIQIYTDNSNCTAAGNIFNGLIGNANPSLRIPLYWQVYTNTNNSLTFSTNNDDDWSVIKDIRDYDWENSLKNRVLISNNILGAFPYSNIITETTNLYIYIASHFYIEKDDTYSTHLYIDFLTETPITSAPGITYSAPDYLNIIGDKIIFYADFSDTEKISKISFFYAPKGDTNFTEKSYYPESYNYRLRAEIPAEKFSATGIEYYFTAENSHRTTNTGTNTIFFIPEVSKKITSEDLDIKLNDGNPEDGTAKLTIPAGSINPDRTITFSQIYKKNEFINGTGITGNQTPLMMYKISPAINFKKNITAELLYLDINNNGKVETIDGIETDISENTLAAFLWDGFTWKYLGGIIDPKENIIRVNISHSSIIGIFSSPDLTKEFFRPKERIVTPNDDGINDCVYFDGVPDNTEIKIMDINGRIIRKLNSNIWDCKDNENNIVESGIYIYQFIVTINNNAKRISGTVLIVK